MAKYVDAFELSDPSFVIGELHCEAADKFVDLVLHERGINPNDVTLPNDYLTEIASLWAKSVAANEASISEDSPLSRKARTFEQQAKLMASKLTRAALGLVTEAGFGSVTLGRG